MKSIHRILIACLVLGSMAVQAQKKTFTPEEVVGMNPGLYPKNLAQLQWMGQTDRYVYVANNALIVSAEKFKTEDTLFTLKQLNQQMLLAGFDSLRRIPGIKWHNENTGYFLQQNKLYALTASPLKTQLLISFPDDAANIELSPSATKAAYTLANNLYIYDGMNHHAITADETGIVNGQTVHRNEFGIDKGIFWAADEQKLAFYSMDERMVASYPLVDVSQRMAALKPEKYPMAGMTSHQVRIGVYNLAEEKTSFLQTGEPKDQYLTSVTWHPNSQIIYTAILNRDQNHLQLKAFDCQNGLEKQLLFEEKDDKYVEPSNPLYFVPGKTDQFIWISERDGFDHLYLYQTDGKLLKQITSGNWAVTDFLGFSPKGDKVFFNATKESPLEQHSYAIGLKTLKTTKLTTTKGMHRSQLSHSGLFILDNYSHATLSREILLNDHQGKTIKTLLTAPNPLIDYQIGETKLVELKADDSTTLFGRLIFPFNFDPGKKYPVVVYVYGGPHAQLVTESWLQGANFYLHYLSQKGYLVFTLDNRGSDNRGKKFEQVIHRHVGIHELADQMKGIDYLKTLPWVDADRIGVDGWSYGGFMSINMKLSHPEVFKVATAGGPVIDWKYYEVMYGERYMDHPDTNEEGYEKSNLLNKVKQLEGKLLVIHGDNDPVVVWQNSLSFLKKCVDEGKLVDYFVYPGHEHNVRGKDRAHLIRKIVTYFDENL